MFGITDPPHVARIVEIPIGNDVLSAFLSVLQKFFRLTVLFIFLAQIHKQVTEN